ncbi:hypothetical protein PEPS_35100 (plasmid) [Persicobacter psychrovividus]|uniref:Uncharacterized protein n=1 Tax=Persicobacter psychrovividus TaxID=387638 RepID=A0ABM7VK41_9BACT|nr:hypothetical protein PEPS_35100 [Persicobacter psychrovividus]
MILKASKSSSAGFFCAIYGDKSGVGVARIL